MNLRALAAAILLAATSVSAHAVLIVSGSLSSECQGAGGFSACWADANGIYKADGPGRSPSVYKFNSNGSSEISTNFPSINGGEFSISYSASNNVLTWSYNPAANDPVIRFFAVFQAGSGRVFSDSGLVPLTNGSISLSAYWLQPGYSHITFFDTRSNRVPEPVSLALLGVALGALAIAARRKR